TKTAPLAAPVPTRRKSTAWSTSTASNRCSPATRSGCGSPTPTSTISGPKPSDRHAQQAKPRTRGAFYWLTPGAASTWRTDGPVSFFLGHVPRRRYKRTGSRRNAPTHPLDFSVLFQRSSGYLQVGAGLALPGVSDQTAKKPRLTKQGAIHEIHSHHRCTRWRHAAGRPGISRIDALAEQQLHLSLRQELRRGQRRRQGR